VEVSDGMRRYEVKSIVPEEIQKGEGIVLFFRPENVKLSGGSREDRSNRFLGKILKLIYLGTL